jgi:hypothetical protein
MSNFATVSLDQLHLVVGGDGETQPTIFNEGAGSIRREITAQGSFQTPVGVKVEGGGSYRSTDTPGSDCLTTMANRGLLNEGNAASLIEACGKLPAR